MADNSKRNSNFWEMVLAVILGLGIFQWIKGSSADMQNFPWWMLIIICIVGYVLISKWRDKIWWKRHEKEELALAKSHGFESWAEYMVEHGAGEEARKSWEAEAEKEKKKRELNSK